MSRWSFDNIPDQTGRRALVTGANTGIGFETARMLALKGAKLILCARSSEKGKAALERILAEKSDAQVSLELIDLADLENVRTFADRLREMNIPLDLLILNAGVMVPPESKTAQGFELQFGVNHLGHFTLTGHLISLLNKREGARVVVVSSTAALRGQMDFEDLNFEKRGYQAWPAYSQSKLANQLFTLELQRRLRQAGSKILVTAAHPGWTATDLQRTSPTASFFNRFVAMKPPQGALPTLRAAVDPEVKGGEYFGPHGFMQIRGYPKQVEMVGRAKSVEDAKQLWQISEDMTGVSYDLPAPKSQLEERI